RRRRRTRPRPRGSGRGQAGSQRRPRHRGWIAAASPITLGTDRKAFACASFRYYETQIRGVLEQALVTNGELLVEILRFLATRRLPPQAGLSAHRTPRARNDMAFGWV